METRGRQPENVVEPAGRRRGGTPAWLPVVGGLFALGIMVAMGVYVLNKGDVTPSTAPPVPAKKEAPISPAIAKPAVAKPVEAGKLVGRWLRPDGDYVLEIRSASADGKIDAAYFNPRPINVSKAEASSEGGKTQVFVQLTDQGYEGNYYTLTYDPDTDRLAGVYHQLTMGQNFEVEFVRMAR